MAEPIARAIVRAIEADIWARSMLGWAWEQIEPDKRAEIRERWIHLVDAHVKRGVCRLLEEPATEEISLPVLGGPPVLVRQPKSR